MISLPDFSKKTAVLGGTFDPPHLGHEELVKFLALELRFKQVLVVPSGVPPLKTPPVASPEARFAMSRLAFLNPRMPQVEVLDHEIKKSRQEPHYSFYTIQELTQERGPLVFVLGWEQAQCLDQWHRFPQLLDLCDWLVFKRQFETASSETVANLQKCQQWFSGRKTQLFIMDSRARSLSSSNIRANLQRTGQIFEGALSLPVAGYLLETGLYGTKLKA